MLKRRKGFLRVSCIPFYLQGLLNVTVSVQTLSDTSRLPQQEAEPGFAYSSEKRPFLSFPSFSSFFSRVTIQDLCHLISVFFAF